jgi:hypothetical protein
METAFVPTAREMGLDGEPEGTEEPFTAIVVLAWLAVGVTVRLVMLFATPFV